jgi:hypothetical protein
MSLEKRTPGAPLTDAELEQRREAARARWKNHQADIATTGAVAGAAAGAGTLGVARRFLFGRTKQAGEPFRAQLRTSEQRIARQGRTATQLAEGGTRGTRLIGTATRTLRSMANRTGKELRAHMAEFSEPYEVEGETVHASLDPEGERHLRQRQAGLRAQADDLAANARPAKRVRVDASVAVPKVKEFERTRRGAPKVAWPGGKSANLTRQGLEEMFAAGETMLGARSMKELEQIARGISTQEMRRHVFQSEGLPVPRLIRPRVTETVRNALRVTPAHTRMVDEGYPTRGARQKLAGEIRADIGHRTRVFADIERQKVQAARQAVKPAMAVPFKLLAVLRGKPARLGAILGGAALGGGLAWHFARRRAEKAVAASELVKKNTPQEFGNFRPNVLAKAAPDDLVGVAAEIYEAGTGVEESLASRIAGVFRDWKTLSPLEMEVRRGALREAFAEDLAGALSPLDAAARGGAGTPVPTTFTDDAGTPRTISFTFDARSPWVTQAIEGHRLKLAGQLADEQLQTIRSVLLYQARSGASPDATARLLRQTIGLTPNQAGHVVTYRAALEGLDPNALNRALRDKRFDGPLKRAIADGTALEPERIDRMVDAYHRRYLAYRALTIARTEGLRAANTGHMAAIDEALQEQPGFTVIKTWIATDDERTRDDHRELNGKAVVGLHTRFQTASGDFIRWPHDDEAPARQVVRCRCTFSTHLVERGTAARFGTSLVADNPEEMEMA